MRSWSKAHLWNFEHFCTFRYVFLPHLQWKQCYWTSWHVSFIWLPLFGNLRFQKWTVHIYLHAGFLHIQFMATPWFVCLVYSLLSNIYFLILFSFYRPPKDRTKLALNLDSWKTICLKIIAFLNWFYVCFPLLFSGVICYSKRMEILWHSVSFCPLK